MILSGSAVQRNGSGSWLASAMKRLMAGLEVDDGAEPRFSRRLVSLAKKPSMALSQEHEVGVKWKVQRRASSRPRASQKSKCQRAWRRLAPPSRRGNPERESVVRPNP